MEIDNAMIQFVKGKYGDFGSNDERKLKLEREEEIKAELKEKYENGELTHEEYLNEYDKLVQGKFVSLNQINEFKLDKDIEIGDIYFVTREKQDPEYPDDSYLCYEVYDRDTGRLIAITDRDYNLNILDKELIEKYPQLEDEVKKMFPMDRINKKNGEIEREVVVKDEVDYENENKIQLSKDIVSGKKDAIYNKMEKDKEVLNNEPKEEEKEAENEQQLIEKVNEAEKDDNNGGKGKVVVAKLIEDPAVRENIPDATARTWFVMYENGEFEMLNGRGEKLESIIQIGQGKEIDSISSAGHEEKNLLTTFAIKGRENGIVFPVTKNNNELQLNIQDRAINPEIIIPVDMEGNGYDGKDNMEYVYAQRTINEILANDEYKNLLKKEPNVANEVLEICYEKNDTSISTIQDTIDELKRKYDPERGDPGNDPGEPDHEPEEPNLGSPFFK